MIHIWLSRSAVMSSVPTGGSVCCACCNAAFHWLSSHLSWNACYAAFYDSLQSDLVNGVLDDVHILMLHISTRKAILLAQGNQEEILGVHQQLTKQSWTVLTTTIAFIIAITINVKYPVIILLSILPIVANVICTRQRSLLLRWRPKVSQARRTRQRSLVLRYSALSYHVNRTTSSSRFVSS